MWQGHECPRPALNHFPALMLMWHAHVPALMLMWQAYLHAIMLMWQGDFPALSFPALMLMYVAGSFPCPHVRAWE